MSGHAIVDDARVADMINAEAIVGEVVDDKGYHSKQVMNDLREMNIRSYTSEPARGRQTWDHDLASRDAVYANRRRIKGERGKSLLKKRGEFVERSFAHCYDTGALRRLYLRRTENVAKRVLIHAAGFNLGLLMRVKYGLRKPRSLRRGLFAIILSQMHASNPSRRTRVILGRLDTAVQDIWQRFTLPNAKSAA